MGRQWTSEETEALKAGIKKYGFGKWKTILDDPEFKNTLKDRSNIDLKDKYRHLIKSVQPVDVVQLMEAMVKAGMSDKEASKAAKAVEGAVAEAHAAAMAAKDAKVEAESVHRFADEALKYMFGDEHVEKETL